VDAAQTLGSGIGGVRALLHVADTPVFVKRIPLTDLERRPENVRSTANLFELPLACQYGVGGLPSFGVWRELAANSMATRWVLDGRAESFPLMYHARVLGHGAAFDPLPVELADVERAAALVRDSGAVRLRIDAIARSTATVTLFLEHVPHVLSGWLPRELARGAGAADVALAMVERSLRTDVVLMNESGLFHFDAHFDNILTDGQRLYFADFGLATSPSFELSATESDFLATNRSHDACHTITRLVDLLVTELTDAPGWEARNETICRVADGEKLDGLLPAASAAIVRYAPIAVVINEFYRQLHLVDRNAPYPLEDVRRACASSRIEIPGSTG
jgi:hypothetical protein